jgi:hypothetical protein
MLLVMSNDIHVPHNPNTLQQFAPLNRSLIPEDHTTVDQKHPRGSKAQRDATIPHVLLRCPMIYMCRIILIRCTIRLSKQVADPGGITQR